MPTLTRTRPVTLDDLYSPFADRADRPAVEPVAAAALPAVYRRLLDHRRHMTVTVEEYYGSPVDVRVLDEVRRDPDYARKIVLTLAPAGRPVQFGVVRVDLDALAPPVRADILAGTTPLGRVLIQHGVLREVHPVGFFRVAADATMAGRLGCAAGAVTYGRLGVITADGRPAVRVAEVLTPVG